MPIEPLEKTFAEDPNRCQGVGPSGQCEFRAEPGRKYCRLHGGSANTGSLLKSAKQTFYELDETEYLKKFSARANMMGYSHDSRSLRSEIGILRATLERLLKNIEDDEGLQFRSGELIALSGKIESLEKTSLMLEKELGQLMSLEEAKQLAGELLEVLFRELDALKEKEDLRIERGKALIERLILEDEIKSDLLTFIEPLGIERALEKIADAFGDIVSGKNTPEHTK